MEHQHQVRSIVNTREVPHNIETFVYCVLCRYHDMANVVDFLVLRQAYHNAMSKDWRESDRFRSIIDGAWWFGTIRTHQPLQDHFPDSPFLCFDVK